MCARLNLHVNTYLLTTYSVLLCWTVGTPELVVDGSGAVTGLAFYRLQTEKNLLDKENEQLKTKLERLRKEFTTERERLNKER